MMLKNKERNRAICFEDKEKEKINPPLAAIYKNGKKGIYI